MSPLPNDEHVELSYTAHWVFDAKHQEDLLMAGDDPALISLVEHQAKMRQFGAAKQQLEGKRVRIRYAKDSKGKYINGTYLVCEVFPECSVKQSFVTLFVYPISPGSVCLMRIHIIRETTIMFQ